MVLLLLCHMAEAVGEIFRSGRQSVIIGAADPEHEPAVILSGGMKDGVVPRLRRDHQIVAVLQLIPVSVHFVGHVPI